MRTSTRAVCCILAVLLASVEAGAAEPASDGRQVSPAPFFNARQHTSEYVGPGRDLPPPAEAAEVTIGYFGPRDPLDPLAGDMWRAAEMAVAEVNARGGYQGKPYRLITAWSENPWASAVRQLAELVFQRRVWAIVGGADSATTHLAEQIVAKAHVPLVSPVSTDKTVNLANVPWTFSLATGDHLLAPLLTHAVVSRSERGRLVRLLTDDHDSRMFARELDQALRGEGTSVDYQFLCPARSAETSACVAQALAARPNSVLLIAGPQDSAHLARQLRASGYGGPIFGGPAMGRRVFLEQAGAAAEQAIFPLLYLPTAAETDFAVRFARQSGHEPDYAAAHTYDAVMLLTAAIETGGLNRARIRDALAELSPWTGVTGAVSFDGLGSNTRPGLLGTIREGRVVALPANPAPPASPTHSSRS